MDYQNLFNVASGIVYFLGGFLLKALWEADKELAEKVGRIEVLVAGQYIKRVEFDAKIDAIFIKLDRIESKLDSKMDKH